MLMRIVWILMARTFVVVKMVLMEMEFYVKVRKT